MFNLLYTRSSEMYKCFGECLQAENDPIAPSRGIPREDINVSRVVHQLVSHFLPLNSFITVSIALKLLYCSLFQANPNCLLLVTPQGGHLGWVAGSEAPFGAPWTDPVVMDFLEQLQKDSSKPPSAKVSQQNTEDLHELEV